MLVINPQYRTRVTVYFVLWAGITLSLLATFLYLMTLVDPGLRELPQKAARMLRGEHGPDVILLPETQYFDIEGFAKEKKLE